MILEPLNDRECLGQLSQRAADAVHRPDVVQLAASVGNTRQLARYLRTLPQLDDAGPVADSEPSVQCDVPQRARILADDPNCVERSITYLAVAENIDPNPWRQLATIDTPLGRHTLPVEDGLPVVLDPTIPRNALHAGLWAIRNARGLRMDAADTLRWISDLAQGEAVTPLLRERLARARNAFNELLDGWGIPPSAVRDVATALALAQRAASKIGPDARRNVCQCAHALDLLRRNLSFKLPGGRKFKVKVNWPLVKSLGATLGPTAAMAAATAAGVPPPVAAAVGAVVAETLAKDTPNAPTTQAK